MYTENELDSETRSCRCAVNYSVCRALAIMNPVLGTPLLWRERRSATVLRHGGWTTGQPTPRLFTTGVVRAVSVRRAIYPLHVCAPSMPARLRWST